MTPKTIKKTKIPIPKGSDERISEENSSCFEREKSAALITIKTLATISRASNPEEALIPIASGIKKVRTARNPV